MLKTHLTWSQWITVVLLAAPPLVLVLCNIGPGRRMNSAQDAIFGAHSIEISVLAALLSEFVLIGTLAVVVRWITGRTLVELFTKRKTDQ